ncbi:MAG: sulfatase-like hydrolase/transferase [Verrucomicrobiales bacterium]|nr:sulfatase-like hydrolase/transferase [Verrucomicrobiales bacterium]
MSRLLFIFLSLGFLLSSSAAEKPNIILIYTDDHGWPDIGSAGIYEDLKTPHLDQLAEDGVRCTNGYVTAPQCVPSRGGLLAGRDQSRFGLETNGSTLEGFNAEETIAERLQAAGYATGQIGKWHLGPVAEITQHGFDDVFAKNSARPAFATYHLDGSDREPGLDETKLYHLDACSQAATAFIDRHARKPFFLYLAYRAPHVPLDAPPKYLERFPGEMPERRRQALAMISAMDDGVGMIREKLKQHQLCEKTLIFFIGDNGAPLKIHKVDAPGGGPGWDGSLNEPMNGEKGMLSEGGIRVPFLAAWPGTIPPGQVSDEPVISLDVAATAMALAGSKSSKDLDGVNLIPYWSGEKKGLPERSLFWRWSTQAATRSGDWKYLRGGSREYLFNLKNDPEEKKNLAKEEPEKLQTLRKSLEDWTEELTPKGLLGDSMPGTWERYYDHYLDGKIVTKEALSEKPEAATLGWIVRNAGVHPRANGLHVIDGNPKGALPPFLARSRIAIPGPYEVRVQFAKPVSGDVSIEWREEGQDDFSRDQRLSLVGGEIQKSGTVASKSKTIHLRVRVPKGNSVIRSIEVLSADGKFLESWNFLKKGDE